jgi:acyl carrier protein
MIIDKVTRVIAEQMGVNADDIDILAPKFRDELGMDSLDDIEMVMALEEEFERDITDADAERFMYASVMDVVRFIESNGKVLPAPVSHKSQGRTFGEVQLAVATTDVGRSTIEGFPVPDSAIFIQEEIGVLGDITVTVDTYHAHVKVDGKTQLTLSRSNGNLENLCRLLMKSSTK